MAQDRRGDSRRNGDSRGGGGDRHGFGGRSSGGRGREDRRGGRGGDERSGYGRGSRGGGSRSGYGRFDEPSGYRRHDRDGERRSGYARSERDGEERYEGRQGDGPRRHHDGDSRHGGSYRGRGRDERRGGQRGRQQGGRGRFGRDERRDSRPPQRSRVPEPSVPESVTPQDLEAGARRELRALGRSNAENVARHLVMVQRLLDDDPELAYQHARYAASHAGRIAVVRESAGIAAYLSGHYHEALRDIRAARRLSGLDLHRAIEADCERALGHLDRALKAAQDADPRQLDDAEEAEIAMVVSGVRHEMGQTELGLVVVEEAIMMFRGDRETLRRLHSVRADRLEELGRTDEAARIRERIGEGPGAQEDDEVEVYDIEEDFDEEAAQDAAGSDDDADGSFAPAVDEQSETAVDEETRVAEVVEDGLTSVEGDGVADDEDTDWSGSFSQRVEAEMAELLGEDDPDAPLAVGSDDAEPDADDATGALAAADAEAASEPETDEEA